MSRVLPPDESARRNAAAELDQNLIVLAGAGTGKTTLLIERLSLLILAKEIPVERIVSLTFTKKAAGEMRERLEQRLRDIIEDKETFDYLEEFGQKTKPQWKKLAQRALEDIPKAQIGTIHSFAGHLLRMHPMEAGVDPKFKEDEGPGFESLFEREWEMWIAEELGDKAPRRELWKKILTGAELTDVRELAERLASPMVDLKAVSQSVDLRERVVAWGHEVQQLLIEFPPTSRSKKFLENLNALKQMFEEAAKDRVLAPELVAKAAKVADGIPDSWEGPEEDLKRLARLARSLEKVDDKFFHQVLEAVLPLVQHVRDEMRRTGLVSFDGLLVFARNLLRDHPSVRESLKVRFDTLLVDEFQDTDPLQGEIVFYLAEELGSHAKHWRSAKLGPGRLFVVGDPKQSIYRFRGADIAAFQAFQERMMEQGAQAETLDANFRSENDLLGFVNLVFPSNMIEEPFLQPPYVPLRSGLSNGSQKKELDLSVEVAIVAKPESDKEKLKADEGRIAEASDIADWIKEHVDPSPDSKGLRYRDISLLFRSANPFGPYLAALKARGIPYLAEGEKSFYRTSEVTDFLNLLAAVANPNDKLALVGVLRSPAGGFTDAEIMDLHLADGLDYRRPPARGDNNASRLYQTLNELSQEAVVRPLGEIIGLVLDRVWSLELASQSTHGDQAMANLIKVSLLAEKWNDQSPLTLRSFVRRFETYREDEREEGENPLADTKYDAVKIMTIHKAKGLEFPVVFLPNLSAPAPTGPKKNILSTDWRSGWIGLRLSKAKKINGAMLLIEEAVSHREAAEEVRVFYVAATRAKKKVISFLRTGGKEKGVFSGYLKKAGLWPSGDQSPFQFQDLKLTVRKVLVDRTKIETRLKKLPFSRAWDPDQMAKNLLDRRAESTILKTLSPISSPTQLMREATLGEPEKWRVIEEDGGLDRDESILVGVVCHKVLEDWDFKTTAAKRESTLKKALSKAARLFELIEGNPASDRIRMEADAILKSYLSSADFERLSKMKIIGKEIPFLYPMKSVAGERTRVMRGVIDLLYESDGRTVIADYKTNRIDGRSLKQMIEHYRPQAEAYCEAVRQTLGHEAEFELIFLREGKSVRC